MEPRPHERGNTDNDGRHSLDNYMLQWSHVLMNVETRMYNDSPDISSEASMEPRPHERGNHTTSAKLARTSQSFNGATSS